MNDAFTGEHHAPAPATAPAPDQMHLHLNKVPNRQWRKLTIKVKPKSECNVQQDSTVFEIIVLKLNQS